MLKPTLMGVDAPKAATWCRCGGLHIQAILAWEANDAPFVVELTTLCLECGERDKVDHAKS